MRSNTVARRADAFVRLIGLGKLAELGEPKVREPEPHSLRWWPLVLLAVATTGYVLLALDGFRHHDRRPLLGMIGYMLVYTSFSTAIFLRAVGPRMIGSVDHPLDERERMVRARAGHISGIVITAAVFLGCDYFGFAEPFGLWMPNTQEWVALGILIVTWWSTLPVLIASWLQPRPERD